MPRSPRGALRTCGASHADGKDLGIFPKLIPSPRYIRRVSHRVRGNRLAPRKQVVVRRWFAEMFHEPTPVSRQHGPELIIDRNHPASTVRGLRPPDGQRLVDQIRLTPRERQGLARSHARQKEQRD